MEDCAFCNIVKGEGAESLVYSDEITIACMDIQPVNNGHFLVIPKAHAAGLSDLDEETDAQISKVGMRVANAIKRARRMAKQRRRTFFTFHLHIIP
jgi:diadenosine tetraphosphate (Ap4A) HIT family hydrolase